MSAISTCEGQKKEDLLLLCVQLKQAGLLSEKYLLKSEKCGQSISFPTLLDPALLTMLPQGMRKLFFSILFFFFSVCDFYSIQNESKVKGRASLVAQW